MQRRVLAGMVCPYCNGPFTVVAGETGTDRRIDWGLVRCRCFEFPIIDGVLLLSLAKGYGGPEDELHPYVPLQVAAIKFLQAKDIDALRAWIAQHSPEVAALLSDSPVEPYLDVSARLGARITPLVTQFLEQVGRFEVIGGTPPQSVAVRAKGRLRRGAPPTREDHVLRLLDYYAMRFYSARANQLALRMQHLPFEGPILSLCCGHGVFENFMQRLGFTNDVVSVDAQLVNLLITRRYSGSPGSYIVHDVQFPLPFRDGAFGGVFSSTCLPEIPSQRFFVDEQVRVTAPSGWTFLDRIWNVDVGARRLDRFRYYRFCQNFFGRLEDYVDMFRERAGTRQVGVDLARPAAIYVDDHGWEFDERRVNDLLAAGASHELSALIIDEAAFPGFVSRPLVLSADALSVSPIFEAAAVGDTLRLERRPQLANVDAEGAPALQTPFPEQLELAAASLRDPAGLHDQFVRSHLVLLPDNFDAATPRLAALLA